MRRSLFRHVLVLAALIFSILSLHTVAPGHVDKTMPVASAQAISAEIVTAVSELDRCPTVTVVKPAVEDHGHDHDDDPPGHCMPGEQHMTSCTESTSSIGGSQYSDPLLVTFPAFISYSPAARPPNAAETVPVIVAEPSAMSLVSLSVSRV